MKLLFLFASYLILDLLFFPLILTAAPYYEGKRITIVVGSQPGGGYDRIARLAAKHLPKYIPGKPRFIIENNPGAASILAANQVYNVARPDGLTLCAPQRGIPYAQLLGVDGVKFDVRKYSWIGSMATESTILCIRTDLPYKTFEDLRKPKAELIMGDTGLGASSAQFCILLKELLGINIKMIFYPASPDVMLAVERKEVDGKAGSYSSLRPYLDRGLVRPLVRGRTSEPGIENLPVDEDLATGKREKTIMAMRSAAELISRPFLAPPGTSPEVLNILRYAFAKASKDPELRDEAKKSMMAIEYTSAEECLKVVSFVLNQPEDIVKEFGKYVKF
ncbi:MAG: Bug family tripartite tricarboxylate transporter substrate binding protein [Thermodesulfobacteriota bacterium]